MGAVGGLLGRDTLTSADEARTSDAPTSCRKRRGGAPHSLSPSRRQRSTEAAAGGPPRVAHATAAAATATTSTAAAIAAWSACDRSADAVALISR